MAAFAGGLLTFILKVIAVLGKIKMALCYTGGSKSPKGGKRMQFGFSYVGLVFLIMLMVPNLLWTKHKPKDYAKYVGNENKVLLAFERVGEVLVSAAALVFADFNCWSAWSWWLVAAFILMVLYEVFWVRYFRGEKTMQSFYSSLLGIPVAGATLPVLAFLLLAVYGKNPVLGAAVLILGIGHIGIHWMHKKEI